MAEISNPPITTLQSEVSWSCPWYQVQSNQLRLANGQTGTYHVIRKAPAVWIVPVTAAGEIAMIRIYRYTVNDWCWEIPAGSLEPGQTLEEAAASELQQEVGGKATDWHYLGQAYTMNGICDEVGHFFVATGVTLGKAEPEPLEIMETKLMPINDVLTMARSGALSDGQTLLALFLSEPLLCDLGQRLAADYNSSEST